MVSLRIHFVNDVRVLSSVSVIDSLDDDLRNQMVTYFLQGQFYYGVLDEVRLILGIQRWV